MGELILAGLLTIATFSGAFLGVLFFHARSKWGRWFRLLRARLFKHRMIAIAARQQIGQQVEGLFFI